MKEITRGMTGGTPVASRRDEASWSEQQRPGSAAVGVRGALMSSLPEQDRQWVLDVLDRHREAQHEADLGGEALSDPVW